MTFKRTSLTATAAAVLTALAGCGGDDGSSSSGSTETTTVSGTVQSPGGESIGYNNWLDYGQDRLASLFPSARADISGLADVPERTPVQLVRLNTDGSVAETLASDETDANGQFSLEVDASTDLSSDVVVQAGTNDSTMRAPAAGDNLDVNPVSEKVVRDVVDRVSNDNFGYDDVEPEQVQSTVEAVEEQLEANDVDVSGSSVDEAVTTVDDNDGTTSEDLLDASASEAGADFVGAKNVAALDFQLANPSTDTARYEFATRLLGASVTDGGEFDRSTGTSERRFVRRTWTQSDSGIDATFSSDVTRTDNDSAKAITFEGEGRFLGSLRETKDALTKGIHSDDGDIFAAVQTDATGSSSILVGSDDWSAPSDFSQTYNMVRMDAYIDESGSSADGQIALAPMLRAEADFTCSSGTCDIGVTRDFGADTRKFFLQQGVDNTSLFAGDSSSLSPFTVNDVTLSSDGTLEGPNEVATRGFIGPDGNIASFMFKTTSSSDFPYQDYYVGVPQGSSCGTGTLDGTYNVVGMEGLMQPASGSTTGEFDMEFERYQVTADGSGGLTRADGIAKKTKLAPFNDLPLLSQEVRTNSEPQLTYGVASNCVVTIQDQEGNRRQGAVSPDGEVLVLNSFTKNVVTQGSSSTTEIVDGSASGGMSIAVRTTAN
ncbi:hypothetical protein [Halofilum ochraceum]|uniref:hypothetical protein n=1 Tax=Halofilum ochraceum TaxID=1611323 RepID=UPI000836D1AC|nr:hypothetical protein [Halofilum ochraceum]